MECSLKRKHTIKPSTITQKTLSLTKYETWDCYLFLVLKKTHDSRLQNQVYLSLCEYTGNFQEYIAKNIKK